MHMKAWIQSSGARVAFIDTEISDSIGSALEWPSWGAVWRLARVTLLLGAGTSVLQLLPP